MPYFTPVVELVKSTCAHAEGSRNLYLVFDSNNIAEAWYDVIECSLWMRFKSNLNQLYKYETVPAKLIFRMMRAESVGSFFQQNVKNKFQCTAYDDK